MVTTFQCDMAYVNGVVQAATIDVYEGRIATIDVQNLPPHDAIRLPGLTLPGLANAHSHAFHRALRSRTHESTMDSFWGWRDHMYGVAERLDPDTYFELAKATYAEMAIAGITAVGEFHYVHHQPDGTPYSDPNAMGEALVAAAREAGVRLTLLDTCYLHAGFDTPAEGVQRRFSDGDAVQWMNRVASFEPKGVVVGAAIHSVRAVDKDSARVVAMWAKDRPLHFHLSEQPAENQWCLEATGLTPTELLAEAGALGPNSTAVHATHLTERDIGLLGDANCNVCFCPTTERDLADGIGPSPALRDAGAVITLGSDGHAVIDILEEARAVELDTRLDRLQRGTHTPRELLAAATQAGMASLGWDAGELRRGALADFISIDLESVRTAGAADPIATAIFAATSADVTDVIVGGSHIVRDRHHATIDDVPAALTSAIAAVT